MSLLLSLMLEFVFSFFMSIAGCSVDTKVLVLAIIMAGGLAGMKGD